MMDLADDRRVEAFLTDELARETRALSAVVPVLRHLLATNAEALVSEAILARVRGMILDLAIQLRAASLGGDASLRGNDVGGAVDVESLSERLMDNEALLGFCHALAAEGLIAERLLKRHGIDPVLSPLLQELIASQDSAIASLAMAAMAAQSRFVQSQRRMELPLGELPAQLFHALTAQAQAEATDGAMLRGLQSSYDEAASRVGLISRLIAALRRGITAALSLEHAGLALFASALSAAARVSRNEGVLACHVGQGLRLSLMLRAAGLSYSAIERQALLIDPTGRAQYGLGSLSIQQAEAMLGDGLVL
ncbi:hypothetical protein [Erythrobacter sp. R86502]|uniref:hypothetical protein n=1 Tax=Erythrobacter sp. R86502 TaxID=3093846 RepID=UPI0036D3FB32